MNDEMMLAEHECVMHLVKVFIAACKKHDLTYFADGGTLLGAARNGDFIPWDDDADFIMPRKDYNKLIFLASYESLFDSKDFMFQTPITDNEYFNVHARLRLNGTTCVSEREIGIKSNKGIFIDIYPLDAAPDDRQQLDDQIGFMRCIGKHADTESIDSKADHAEAFAVMNDVLTSMTCKNDNSKYVAVAVFYRYSSYMTQKFLRSAFDNVMQLDFHGIKIDVPIGYEQVLEAWYGKNWMTPIQQSAMHSSFIDPFNDYKKYEKMTWAELMKEMQKQ